MQESEAWDKHDRFKELCALAHCKALSAGELRDLDRHLKVCASCRGTYEEYSSIGKEGMAFLAADEELTEEALSWDRSSVRESLLASVRQESARPVLPFQPARRRGPWGLTPSNARRAIAIASLAACAILALTLGAYRMGERTKGVEASLPTALTPVKQKLAAQSEASVDASVAAQDAQISHLQKQIAAEHEELAGLRAAAMAAEQQVSALRTVNGRDEATLRQLTEERDQLASRVNEKEKAYETLQADYNSLRAEHNRSLLQAASLETELTDLRATNKDQEGRLKDDEQYLTSDRDIRELMGARKLYIADVFDVDSVSRTRKPFGRVFYTQNKSLVFYAFDLDHQSGIKNASVFQVWGQRDAETNGASHAMNLGILYMDSELNRRWVLRSDDPKQLAEIDAVFVTVEPHGGSQKPTGKPLLYALLRKEANHP